MKFSPRQREALKIVADGRFVPTLVREDDGWHARWQATVEVSDGVAGWIDEYVRAAVVTRLTEDAEDQKHETLHDAWMAALASVTGLVRHGDSECEAFAAELREWSGAAEEDVAARRAIEFSLVPNGKSFRIECAIPHGRKALAALGQATYVWGTLRGLVRNGGDRLSVELAHSEAEAFVRSGARELADAGYSVSGVDLAAEVTAAAELETDGAMPKSGSLANVRMKLTVRVAGEPVTAGEIRFLLEQNSTLVFFRNRWIEVDRNILKEALRALEKGVGKDVHPISFALGIGHVGKLEIDELASHGWLRGLVNELRRRSSEIAPRCPAIDGFRGVLRDYQRRGVAWLGFLTEHGFGALLADDMGLGKTVQTIAWILSSVHGRTLIVAPLTLLSNWAHEFASFAPMLKLYVHQGNGRSVGVGFARRAGEAAVVLTSYNLLVKDYSSFSETKWDALVLDEAQTIKNPDTQVARAVKALSPARRIALTGTPIENSVMDVWSLEDFLNPTFLGDRKSFFERFARPIALYGQCYAAKRLKHALEPFVMRRLKSDPEIAAELGEKREIKEYCALTAEQRRDYESALADFRAHERHQGDVFALITALKLICDGAGKIERLLELVGQILEAGESVLVFTQYAKVGKVLQDELYKRFGRKFPFLHGALSTGQRDRAVKEFQASVRPGVFILSLKAGGYGLNLTKATHVVHFDRWWNPAVENQATDRVHRIGQTKTVFVHAFITAGTLEEHVDEILERKSATASSVITEAEWLEAIRLEDEP